MLTSINLFRQHHICSTTSYLFRQN